METVDGSVGNISLSSKLFRSPNGVCLWLEAARSLSTDMSGVNIEVVLSVDTSGSMATPATGKANLRYLRRGASGFRHMNSPFASMNSRSSSNLDTLRENSQANDTSSPSGDVSGQSGGQIESRVRFRLPRSYSMTTFERPVTFNPDAPSTSQYVDSAATAETTTLGDTQEISESRIIDDVDTTVVPETARAPQDTLIQTQRSSNDDIPIGGSELDMRYSRSPSNHQSSVLRSSLTPQITISQAGNAAAPLTNFSSILTRSEVVSQCLRRLVRIFQRYTALGASVRISIVTFSTRARVRVRRFSISEGITNLISRLHSEREGWFRPSGHTNIAGAIELVNSIVEEAKNANPDAEIVSFLLTDGRHNAGDVTRGELLESYSSNFSAALGVGNRTSGDLDQALIDAIGETSFFADDANSLNEKVEGFLFGSTSLLARDVSILIDQGSHSVDVVCALDPSDETEKERGGNSKLAFFLDVCRPGHVVPFFLKGGFELDEVTTTISYIDVSKEKQQKTFVIKASLVKEYLNDSERNEYENVGKALEVYCTGSRALLKIQPEELKEGSDERHTAIVEHLRTIHNEVSEMLKLFPISETGEPERIETMSEKTRALLFVLQQNVDAARSIGPDRNYVRLLRRISSRARDVSSGGRIPTSISRSISMKFSFPDDERDLCRICFSEPLSVVMISGAKHRESNGEAIVSNKICTHLAACTGCASRILEEGGSCPICKSIVTMIREVKLVSSRCVCRNRNVNTAFSCGHAYLCRNCAETQKEEEKTCVVCHTPITSLLKFIVP